QTPATLERAIRRLRGIERLFRLEAHECVECLPVRDALDCPVRQLERRKLAAPDGARNLGQGQLGRIFHDSKSLVCAATKLAGSTSNGSSRCACRSLLRVPPAALAMRAAAPCSSG